MRKMLATVAALSILAACNNFKKTEDGLEYKILRTDESARMVAKGDLLHINMLMQIDGKDTTLFDTYKDNKPFQIPSEEPTLKSVFAQLRKGDSVFFKVIADTLYAKSFGQPLPSGIAPGSIINVTASLTDLYSIEEMQKKIQEKNEEFLLKDSIASEAFLKNEKNLITTASGLHYTVIKGNKGGKAVKTGDKVTVKYKGYLLDGSVFDQTKEGQPDFTFNVGMSQVIQGWDEGLQLMKEGETFKFIIPWKLGYGPRGSGPIPPFSTLVFEVELVKVN